MDAARASLLAPYAMHDGDTRGRRRPEPPHPYRGPFQRDRDRVTHSAAYRRLSHKTQVFTGDLGDYHRSRLTHTLEATSIARTLARALGLNEDLAEALAILHDLGHPPFGHAGEEALNACLKSEGGFSHNRQALRIVELLEQRYPGFPGLNLSFETLEGQAARAEKGAGALRPLLEAQIVDAADGVAYDTHDADDALELGLLNLPDLLETQLWQEAGRRVKSRYSSLSADELRRTVLHELIDWQVGDLLAQARRRLAEWDIRTAAAARAAPPIVEHSAELQSIKAELQAFLHARVYRHPQVIRLRETAQECLKQLFALLVRRPELLPEAFRRRAAECGVPRSAGDYLAGMTDRFAQREFERLLNRGTVPPSGG